jgi:hypothetical protein
VNDAEEDEAGAYKAKKRAKALLGARFVRAGGMKASVKHQ